MRTSVMKKLLVFLIMLVLIAGAVYGGIRFVLGTGRDIGVKATDKDFDTAMQKAKVKVANIEDINLTNLSQGKFETAGKVNVDASFSNEEMSSMISRANQNKGPIKDVQIKFLDGGQAETNFRISDEAINFIKTNETLKGIKIPGLALSAMNGQFIALTDFLADYISKLAGNASVYAKGSLVKTSANSVNVRIDELAVGKVTMSDDVKRKVEQGTRDFVNALITSKNGFTIEELRVENGKLYYKGTLPEEIKSK